MHGLGGVLLRVATQQTNIRFACKRRQGTISEVRRNDNFNKLLLSDHLGNFGVNLLIEGNNAAKAGYRIGGKCLQIGVDIIIAQRHAARVGVLDNDTGRLLAELTDGFLCGIRIVDIVVGKFLALDLLGGSNTAWLDTRLHIKSGRLVGVFAVTEFLSALELWCDVFRKGMAQPAIDVPAAEIGCDETVITGSMGKGLCRQGKSCAC